MAELTDGLRGKLDVSVVLATYNGANFIEEQLDSLRAQTYPINEVLITDDCSSDETVSIVKNYITKFNLDNKWRLVCNNKNKGYACNFMDAAFGAHNDLIFFCDQDDIWLNDKIESMVKVLEKHRKINMLASDLELFYVDENALHWDSKDTEVMSNSRKVESVCFSLVNIHCQRSGCTMCIRRDFLQKIKPYWRKNWAQDDFIWKCSILSDCCGIYHYKGIKRRMHGNNATNIKVRTRKKRIQQLYSENENMMSLRQYVKDFANEMESVSYKEKVIDKLIVASKLRIKTVEDRNIFAWIRLALGYRKCFPRMQTLMLDGYFTLFSNYKSK